MIHIQSEKRPIETLGVSQISDTADKNFKAVIKYMFIEPKKIIMKEKSVAKINLQVEILHKETEILELKSTVIKIKISLEKFNGGFEMNLKIENLNNNFNNRK